MKHAILFIAALVVGCAAQTALPPSIHADAKELAACAAAPTGCSVWTDEELTTVVTDIMIRSVQYGRNLERGAL